MPQIVGGKNITDPAQLNAGVVTTAKIAADAVTKEKIAADQVEASEIATGAVGTAEIADGAIENIDIAAAAAIADTKLATISTAGKVSGAALTSLTSIPAGAGVIPSANIPSTATSHSSGITSRDLSLASGTQTIAHNLSGTPKKIKLTEAAFFPSTTLEISIGVFDGNNKNIAGLSNTSGGIGSTSTTYAIILRNSQTGSNYQTGVVSVDATNITITWTKVGLPTGTIEFLWEAML